MVLWLCGEWMYTDRMKECLSTKEFFSKVKTFIATKIHADLPDIHDTHVLSIPCEPHVTFSWPVDPWSPQSEEEWDESEKKLAWTIQAHQCGQDCIKLVHGQFSCKRKAPFSLEMDNWTESDERWGPKWTCRYFNRQSWHQTHHQWYGDKRYCLVYYSLCHQKAKRIFQYICAFGQDTCFSPGFQEMYLQSCSNKQKTNSMLCKYIDSSARIECTWGCQVV